VILGPSGGSAAELSTSAAESAELPDATAKFSALQAAGRFAQRSAEMLAANRRRQLACLFTFVFPRQNEF